MDLFCSLPRVAFMPTTSHTDLAVYSFILLFIRYLFVFIFFRVLILYSLILYQLVFFSFTYWLITLFLYLSIHLFIHLFIQQVTLYSAIYSFIYHLYINLLLFWTRMFWCSHSWRLCSPERPLSRVADMRVKLWREKGELCGWTEERGWGKLDHSEPARSKKVIYLGE